MYNGSTVTPPPISSLYGSGSGGGGGGGGGTIGCTESLPPTAAALSVAVASLSVVQPGQAYALSRRMPTTTGTTPLYPTRTPLAHSVLYTPYPITPTHPIPPTPNPPHPPPPLPPPPLTTTTPHHYPSPSAPGPGPESTDTDKNPAYVEHVTAQELSVTLQCKHFYFFLLPPCLLTTPV